MARKKANKYEYIISRAKYKAIKAFDHKQMEAFLTDVYKNGYQDGRCSVPGVDVKEVIQAIAQVKGIGSKRLQEIEQRIEAAFSSETEERSTEA